MDGAGGGEMKIETQEAEVEVSELERLENPTPEDLDQMLEMLGYDALNDRTPEDRHQIRTKTSRESLYRNFHAAGKHGELFVVRGHGDKIIGLIGLRADAPNQTGHITMLRSSTREKAQFGIAEKLLKAAERYLREGPRNCTKAIIEGPNLSQHLKGAAHHGSLSRFYEIEEKSGAANDNSPDAPSGETYQREASR